MVPYWTYHTTGGTTMVWYHYHTIFRFAEPHTHTTLLDYCLRLDGTMRREQSHSIRSLFGIDESLFFGHNFGRCSFTMTKKFFRSLSRLIFCFVCQLGLCQLIGRLALHNLLGSTSTIVRVEPLTLLLLKKRAKSLISHHVKGQHTCTTSRSALFAVGSGQKGLLLQFLH